MTAIELYKLVNHYGCEWHILENNGKKDVILFIDFPALSNFCFLLSAFLSDEKTVILKTSYIALWMNEVCDYYDINIDEIFPPANEPL
jgi:hypothetical protein